MSETAIPLDPNGEEELDSAGLTAEQNVEIDKLVNQGLNYPQARAHAGAKPLEALGPETPAEASADQLIPNETTPTAEDAPPEE